jgi:hypothetical protein
LSWSASNATKTYEVKKTVDHDGSFATIAGGLTTPVFRDIAIMRGHTYTYKVIAVSANGESGDSNEASVIIAGPVRTGVAH